jgi:hypothetical protein
LPREARLWREFQRDMHSPDPGEWMWVQPTDVGRPPDLGYWIGYRIVRSYYDRAGDKRQAVLDILDLTDFEEFLERSGYPGGWGAAGRDPAAEDPVGSAEGTSSPGSSRERAVRRPVPNGAFPESDSRPLAARWWDCRKSMTGNDVA